MLFFAICFIFCYQGIIQTSLSYRIRNPLNLIENGFHVCSKKSYERETYATTTTGIRYSYYTTSCGWGGLRRCGRSRKITFTRYLHATRTIQVKIISCCNGWRKDNTWSRICAKAICSQGCAPRYGTCIAPNRCQCNTGWTGSTCTTDVNECASSSGGCDQVCTNTPGSYQCSCNPGYTQSGHRCQDIDECSTVAPCQCGISGERCGANCTNQIPGYSCSCANGFRLRPSGTICDDVDECSTAKGGCSQRCSNFPGGFTCGCYTGFNQTISNGTIHCKDINECLSSNGFCSHQCVNTAGSYFCRCQSGHFLDSNGRTCSDHDECSTGFHGCQHKCNNFHGGYFCSCNAGYALNKDNRTCSDVNECAPVYVEGVNTTVIPAGCEQLCHNTPGNFTCSCNQGYRLLYDGKRCRDVNECSTGTHSCNQICLNTPGSYGCSCFYGYKLKADLRSCGGLPCEAIMAPPNGRMNCSGLVTNEACWFTCDHGYNIEGSERRVCLNSSKWGGQQTFCRVKSCGRLLPPTKGKVYLPCFTTFGSSCTLGCVDGYLAVGDTLAHCRVNNTKEVAWNTGNFTCEETFLCKPNPCRHDGRCTMVNSQQFSCDCQNTGYEGNRCEIGIVTLPDFPKLTLGSPSEKLVLQARPDNSLTVKFNSATNLTIQPEELAIKHPSSKAKFQVTGQMSGVGVISYNLSGKDKYSFSVPESSFVFVGRNVSIRNSVYTRFGLLVGELPMGRHIKKIENFQACSIMVAFDGNTAMSKGTVIHTGPVHIISPDNKTIPLSLVGYNFSSPNPSRKEVLERLVRHTRGRETRVLYSSSQLSAGDVIELIQNDALPKSIMRHFSDQLPLWLKFKVTGDNQLFDINNTLAYIVQSSDANSFHPFCKFPNGRESVVTLYRPLVNYNISVEKDQLSLSSKDSCFATDICNAGVFLTLSKEASDKVRKMMFLQDMASAGWHLSLSSFGFPTARRYNRILSSIPDGHLAENFSDFHYNIWLQGKLNIHLATPRNFSLKMNMSGEAFVFTEILDALFTKRFSQPVKVVFDGSVDFNITLEALGQIFTLSFSSSEVMGKANFGGTLTTSRLSDECRVPQGFVLVLERSSKPFITSPLANIISPNDGFKYLQIFHSVSGGQDLSAQDRKNNLRFLEWQTQEIRRILVDLKTYVPALKSETERWEAVAGEMLTTVIKARLLLFAGSDLFKLKLAVEKLDNALDTITRAFDLLVTQLETYKNESNIEKVIDRLIRLQTDLPKGISLSFLKSAIPQSFVGIRFRLVAKVCHMRLCFQDVKSSIWSLQPHNNQCGTSSSRQKAGLLVEGKALRYVSLSGLITFPAGGTLHMFLTRHRDVLVTTFESLVNLLGLKKPAVVRMDDKELSFLVWGPMFGEFDAYLNVKAQIKNVTDWNSVVFTVEGTMNRSSHLYNLLEGMVRNESTKIAEEATRRLANARAAFNDAQRQADVIEEDLQSKQSIVKKLEAEMKVEAEDLRKARLKYLLAKRDFNNSIYAFQNVRNSICEIRECNYTCSSGCVIPGICQDPINITYLEPRCRSSTKIIKVYKWDSDTKTITFTNKVYKTIYTGSCPSHGEISAGYHVGGVKGAFAVALSGCSETWEVVRDFENEKPEKFESKTFKLKAKDTKITEVKCTGHTEKTKPGGFGPPHECCKEHGCPTKVLDAQCTLSNKRCEDSMNDLKFTINSKHTDLQSKFNSFQNDITNVKKATFSYEKARVRYESAVARLEQVKAHKKQHISATEIANVSMLHVARMVGFGLKIWKAMNSSNSTRVVNLDEIQFFISLSSGLKDPRRIVFQSNTSSVSGERVPISFLVDFDQVARSLSSASKNIVAKLFSASPSRRKRSTPEALGNNVYSQHSSFLDYRYACLFANRTHLYLSDIFQTLEVLITSVRALNINLSSGFNELVKLSVNLNSSVSNTSSLNATNGYSNSSFVTEYLGMIQVFKEENINLSDGFYQSWNNTLQVWRAFLETFTSAKGFTECSGTQDCIEYFFDGLKEFYEFEDSPRALEIKDAIPRLRQLVKALTTETMIVNEAEQALNYAASLLNKTRDKSVLCGGTPLIVSSSRGEVVLFPGDSLSLNCSANKEYKLTYAWKKNDHFIGESLYGTFYLHHVTKGDEGAYVCMASNNKGSTFSNVTIVKIHRKLKITQHPQSQRVVFRSQIPAIFVCNATADPSPTFQWFFQSHNSTVVKINWTKPLFYLTNPHIHQEGYYYCEASNQHGVEVSQRARLDVLNYTIGLPRLLVAFNITTQCSQTPNPSNISAHDLCSSESLNVLPSALDKNLTNKLLQSLSRSLDLPQTFISELRFRSRSASKPSVLFVLDLDNQSWKGKDLTTYVKIVKAIADEEANMIGKLKQLNSHLLNKTFTVPWNNNTLLGEPDSITVFPLPPECPKGQSISENGFICANCPAGSHYTAEDKTCVECPVGAYQPVQGQTECISCGANLTTALNGTVEESDCIAECPAGSYSAQNRTCILCPLDTYQPSAGQITCLSCGKNLTTASTGTKNKVDCIKNEPPTSNIPTAEEQSTIPASPSVFPTRILEVKLFYRGNLDSFDTKDKKQILLLIEKEVSILLSVELTKEKKSEITFTDHGVQVTLFVNAVGFNGSRLEELLNRGIEIEYSGKKLRFTELIRTEPPPTTFPPRLGTGEMAEQKSDKQLPWKLPVIVTGPVILAVGIVALVLVYRRRRTKKYKTFAKTAKQLKRYQYDNPVYVASIRPAGTQQSESFFMDASCSDIQSDGLEKPLADCTLNPVYDTGPHPVEGASGIEKQAGNDF